MVLVLLLSAPGCRPHPDDEVPPRDPPVQQDEYGTAPAIVVHFEEPDLRGTHRMPHFVNLLVTNTTRETLNVSLTLVGFGLDQRRSNRSYGSYVLRGGEQRTIPIAAARFPLRSHSAPATIFAEGRVTVNGQRLSVTSERLTAAFDHALSTVTFHGIGNAYRDLRHPRDPRLERRRLHSLAAELLDVAGDVWVTDRYVPVDRLPPNGAGGGTIRYSGGSDTNEPWPASMPDPSATHSYDIPPPGPNRARLCGSWLAKFVDSGFGEDHLTSKDWNIEPARFASAQVWSVDTAEVIFAGHLNSLGCTPFVQLAETGSYLLTVFTTLRSGESKIDIESVPSTGGAASYTSTSNAFVKTSANTSPLNLHFHLSHLPLAYANTAAVMGLALVTPDNGFPAAPNTTTVTLYDDCCQADGQCYYACAGAGTIKFGRSNKKLLTGQYIMTTDYKYTIGHELGHVIHGFGSGVFYRDYGAWKTDGAPPECGCEHITSSNQLHCLQSRETTTTAHVEAFAHFYASKLMNHASGSGCTFVYYKDVHFLGTTLPPPVATDCTYPVRWLESECLANGRGVQWDWNNFLWSIHTAPPAQRTSLDDLFAIYRQGCGGTKCAHSVTDSMAWPTFDGAALAHYGQFDNRYLKVGESATTYGVNH
ncbi:MAG: hypothetical protein KF718_26475 [Polyangiaceae bacterium]|nr:hypothetical protein [Polyangiaceae bacterium]